jgi:hypothetical protein
VGAVIVLLQVFREVEAFVGEVYEGVDLAADLVGVLEPLEVDHEDLWEFPQIEFFGGLVSLLTRKTEPEKKLRGWGKGGKEGKEQREEREERGKGRKRGKGGGNTIRHSFLTSLESGKV